MKQGRRPKSWKPWLKRPIPPRKGHSAEILDRIDSNRIEMQENVSTGPAEGSYDFEYDEEDIDIEEVYGSDYITDREGG